MIVFALIAVGWWLAAPDRFTAAARTASGTGLKAAGTGAKVHWNGGRDGRALGRTKRRDRWAKRGGWWRRLLGLEHGAVITGKAVKGTGRLAGAAVKPVPGAIRDGWRAGQARHGARTAGRPVPVALDPPWWRKPDPAPVPSGTGQGSPQDSGTATEDSPEPDPGQPEGEPVQGVDNRQPRSAPFFPDAPDGPVLDTEDEIRARNPELALITPDPLTEGQRRFWHLRDRGYPGALDQDGWPAPDFHTGALVNPMPYLNPPAGTAPAGTATDDAGDPMPTWQAKQEYGPDWAHAMTTHVPDYKPTNPGGTVSPTPFGAELDDLTSVQDFAVKVADMAEESDFAQLVEFCKHASDETRDFGADMAGDVAEFEEIAAKIGDLLSELVDAAQHVRDRSAELIGG